MCFLVKAIETETAINIHNNNIDLINDKSLIIDIICDDLEALGIDLLFRSGNIKDGLSQLLTLGELPQVCIIDLVFSNSSVLTQLYELRSKYPTLKLITHSDKDSEQIVNSLLELRFDSYILIGSDADDIKKAIERVCKGKKYISTGVSKIVQEYFNNKAEI